MNDSERHSVLMFCPYDVGSSEKILLIYQSSATSREVPGSITGGVTGDFFRGSPLQNHVPWGQLSL